MSDGRSRTLRSDGWRLAELLALPLHLNLDGTWGGGANNSECQNCHLQFLLEVLSVKEETVEHLKSSFKGKLLVQFIAVLALRFKEYIGISDFNKIVNTTRSLLLQTSGCFRTGAWSIRSADT